MLNKYQCEPAGNARTGCNCSHRSSCTRTARPRALSKSVRSTPESKSYDFTNYESRVQQEVGIRLVRGSCTRQALATRACRAHSRSGRVLPLRQLPIKSREGIAPATLACEQACPRVFGEGMQQTSCYVHGVDARSPKMSAMRHNQTACFFYLLLARATAMSSGCVVFKEQ